uniref:Uncharacterized protein n=1 Tax=Equus asinus TaxID=9793 RepID=A0A9L0IX03_EQUAS
DPLGLIGCSRVVFCACPNRGSGGLEEDSGRPDRRGPVLRWWDFIPGRIQVCSLGRTPRSARDSWRDRCSSCQSPFCFGSLPSCLIPGRLFRPLVTREAILRKRKVHLFEVATTPRPNFGKSPGCAQPRSLVLAHLGRSAQPIFICWAPPSVGHGLSWDWKHFGFGFGFWLPFVAVGFWESALVWYLFLSVCLSFQSVNMGGTISVPPKSPLGKILADWSTYSYKPMRKNQMVFYCNTAWPMCVLESEERWPLNGTLNYYTILQLEWFCERSGKWDEIPYVQAFMRLHNQEGERPGTKLMVQRKAKPPVVKDIRTPEEKLDEDITALSVLNPFNPNFNVTQPPMVGASRSPPQPQAAGSGREPPQQLPPLCLPVSDEEVVVEAKSP